MWDWPTCWPIWVCEEFLSDGFFLAENSCEHERNTNSR